MGLLAADATGQRGLADAAVAAPTSGIGMVHPAAPPAVARFGWEVLGTGPRRGGTGVACHPIALHRRPPLHRQPQAQRSQALSLAAQSLRYSSAHFG